MKEIPVLSSNLIEQLVTDEPSLDITPKMAIHEIMFKAGRWAVLNELRLRLEYSNTHNTNKNTVEI